MSTLYVLSLVLGSVGLLGCLLVRWLLGADDLVGPEALEVAATDMKMLDVGGVGSESEIDPSFLIGNPDEDPLDRTRVDLRSLLPALASGGTAFGLTGLFLGRTSWTTPAVLFAATLLALTGFCATVLAIRALRLRRTRAWVLRTVELEKELGS